MSKSVVTAAAAAHARHLGQKKLIKKSEDQNPAQDDQQAVDGKEEAAKAVQTENGISQQTSMSDAPLGAFSFEGALAEASAGLAGETSVQDDAGMGEEDGDGSGTILLVGAVALAGAGIAVAASGGGNSNEAPVLADITAKTTAEDTVLTFPVTATDPDGDTLTFSVGSAVGGTAAVANGTVTFTPTANFNGAASLVVTVTDSEGLTDTQTVNITVSPVNNDAPIIAAISAQTTNEDTPVVIPVTTTDPDGGTPVVTVGGATNGSVSFANGSATFTPVANYNGPASFVVTSTDAGGLSSSQTVNITVTPVNDAPFAGPDTDASIITQVGVTVPFVIDALDIDSPDSALAATITDAPDHGTIGQNANGPTYIPTAGYVGADSFSYQVSDGAGGTYTQTVAVTVNPAGPVFASGAASTIAENSPASTTVYDANATGTGAITFGLSGADAGAFNINAVTGIVTFKASPDFETKASYAINVTAQDSNGTTSQAVSIAVTDVEPENVQTSIDVGIPTGTTPVTLSAANGDVQFTDNANVNTFVLITDFTEGDEIVVSNLANLNSYSFGTGSGAGADDLIITYNNPNGTATSITLEDIGITGFVLGTYESAVAAVGYDFMSIA